MALIISLLFAGLLILILNTFIALMNGEKGKKGELKRIFSELDGMEEPKKKYFVKRSSFLRMNSKQFLMIFAPVGFLTFIFSWIFFRSIASAIIITLISTLYPYYFVYAKKRKLKLLLNYQLRDALNALLASLKAGSSLSNALIRTYDDLEKIFQNEKDKPIVDEFRIIAYELDLMLPVEEVLINFTNRNNIEDISDFVNVTLMTKNQGGNLNEIIQRVTEIISDRIQIEQEIHTLVAGKKMEAKVLTILPVLLVIILSLISPDYMSPLYETLLGRILMLFATVLLIANYFVGKKIIEIEV
ncbi:MAG: type II secretion system F family protein [Clostridia bacterium]|nr:type II secretion system F family protein [Clostridia bacterium]